MAFSVKRELHDLVDRLSDSDALTLLEDARRLAVGRTAHKLPVRQAAPPLANIDVLCADVFPASEDADDFDETIRRWRIEGSAEHDDG